MKDLSNQKYGRLTVTALAEVKRYPKQTKSYWYCKCECGRTKTVRGEHLTSGRIASCGCKYRDVNVTHGHARRNDPSLTYRSWVSMKSRVLSPDEIHKTYYATIRICERWLDFTNFLADMGERPSKDHSIDRIDNNGHYEPDNCRWATRSENMKNTRRAEKYR